MTVTEKNYLLSIIVPTYNSERFIAATLDMLISQGLEDCEVIIIDDGSVDETRTIIKNYKNQYNNIKVIEQEHSGVSVGRNKGIELASGQFIFFLDSDDTLENGTLDFYRECIRNNQNAEIIAFSFKKSFPDSKSILYESKKYDKKSLSNQELVKAYFGKYLIINICSFLINKDFLHNHNLSFTPGVRIGEDVEFIVKAVFYCNVFKYFARPCFVYKIRSDSTFQSEEKITLERLSGLSRRIEFLRESNTTNNPYINLFMANSYLANVFGCAKRNALSKEDDVYAYFLKNNTLLHQKIRGNLKKLFAIKICSCFSFPKLVLLLSSFYNIKGKK